MLNVNISVYCLRFKIYSTRVFSCVYFHYQCAANIDANKHLGNLSIQMEKPVTTGQSLLKSFVKETNETPMSGSLLGNNAETSEEKIEFISPNENKFQGITILDSHKAAQNNTNKDFRLKTDDDGNEFGVSVSADIETRTSWQVNFQRWCRIGQVFLFHKNNSKPSPTHMRVNKSGTHIFAATAYNKTPIAIKKINKIVLANMIYDNNDSTTKSAPKNNKYWNKADPNVCFSIYSDDTIYHLEAMTNEIRDLWVKGINQLIMDQTQLQFEDITL